MKWVKPPTHLNPSDIVWFVLYLDLLDVPDAVKDLLERSGLELVADVGHQHQQAPVVARSLQKRAKLNAKFFTRIFYI